MPRIRINPYSAEGGFTKAREVAQAAGATFIPTDGSPFNAPCFIECEHQDAPTVLVLLKEQGLEARYVE
jgi:hypothetical protein